MLFPSVLLGFAALAGLAAAQGDPNSCCNLTNPGSVDLNVRRTWCVAQFDSCSSLCGDSTEHNDCDPELLTYNCECYQASTPNISDYAQTLPSLECQAWVGQCVDAHPNNLSAITQCRDNSCGSRNASAFVVSSSSSSSAAESTTTSASATSAAAASATTTSGNYAAVPLAISREASTGVVGAILFAVFGIFL